MVTPKKILSAAKKRLAALRDEYRRGRAFYYDSTRAMDSVWAEGLERVTRTAGADAQAALVDALAADLKPYLAAVPSTAPAAQSRRKTAPLTPG